MFPARFRSPGVILCDGAGEAIVKQAAEQGDERRFQQHQRQHQTGNGSEMADDEGEIHRHADDHKEQTQE